MEKKNLQKIALKYTVDLLGADGEITTNMTLSQVLENFFEYAKDFEEQVGKKMYIDPLGQTVYGFRERSPLHACPICNEYLIAEYVDSCPKCLTEVTWESEENGK